MDNNHLVEVQELIDDNHIVEVQILIEIIDHHHIVEVQEITEVMDDHHIVEVQELIDDHHELILDLVNYLLYKIVNILFFIVDCVIKSSQLFFLNRISIFCYLLLCLLHSYL